MRKIRCFRWQLMLCLLSAQMLAQQEDATVHVRVLVVSGAGPAKPISATNPVVVWLSPLDATPFPAPAQVYKMSQKNKEFTPHLLVVPVGSKVEFPNLDPFFHNVFSLFNGKRFDLGLYQTGKSGEVTLAREGVSYVFCNIHPEMGGVIISLSTPFYAVSRSADVSLRGVRPGSYRLSLWSEQAAPESLKAASRIVAVTPGTVDLGNLNLVFEPPSKRKHPNKFGDAYPFPNP